jgi:hypothetical protein
MAPTRAREPVLRLPPPPATWDVGEASSSAYSSQPIIDRRCGDQEEEAQLAAALAESATTAAAKKRQEEEETAAAIAAVELFKQQGELEAGTWAEGDSEAAIGEGNAEADTIVIHSNYILVDGGDNELAFWASEDAASSGELATTIFPFLAVILL